VSWLPFITVTPANAPDKSVLEELLEQKKENLGQDPENLLGDTVGLRGIWSEKVSGNYFYGNLFTCYRSWVLK